MQQVIMRSLASKLAGILTIAVLSSCSLPRERSRPGVENSGPESKVMVTLDGSVQHWGKVMIRPAFCKESIEEAGHGWRKETASPQSFTLERISSGQTNSWKIRFDEMDAERWRGTQFQAGDHITVHTIYF